MLKAGSPFCFGAAGSSGGAGRCSTEAWLSWLFMGPFVGNARALHVDAPICYHPSKLFNEHVEKGMDGQMLRSEGVRTCSLADYSATHTVLM